MKNTRSVFFVLLALMFLIVPRLGDCAAKQAPTDTLVVALSTLEAETFLPWNGGGGRTTYLAMIYDYPLYLDPVTVEPTPGLATKWEMSKDGKTWTFWLRQGIQFHEGWGELTAEDVKYSMERVKAPDSVAGSASSLRKLVAKVEAPERYKVVFYLTSTDLEFDGGFMSNGSQAMVVVCKKYLETVGDEKANAHPIGTGPYTLAEFKRGTSIKLKTIEGVEKHWRVTPEFKEVTFLAIPEEATRVAMLKKGEVDLAPISYDSIDTIKASGLKIVSIPRNWTPVIRLGGLIMTDPKRSNPQAPWADKRVRQALNYAVDKKAIIKNIFKGEASPSGSSVSLADFLDLEPYPYDSRKAKQLLTEAGYPKGFPITLKTFTTNPGAELPMIGEAVAMYWKTIDLDIKIAPTDWGTVRGEWTGGKANNYAWTHRGLPPTSVLTSLMADFDAASLFSSYVTKETEAWINKIVSEFDAKKRKQLTREFGQYLRDEASGVFLVNANEPYGASKKIGNWQTVGARPQNIELITHR
jgi:peptide/nickel transport system substrate-binding protein